MTKGQSYRQVLQNKLTERCASRPGYSLRAFARDLGYGASQLSRVMNGKQHLSVSTARMVADKLFDSEVERNLFLAMVELEGSSRPAVKAAAKKKLNKIDEIHSIDDMHLMQQDAFHIISDWYHLPILDLMTLHQPPKTHAAVAKYLGITAIEAKLAIERLLRVGMLKEEKGRWIKTHTRLFVPSGGPNDGVRKFHRGMIGKALESIDSQSVDQRYLVGRTIAVTPQDLATLRAMIEDFSKKLSEVHKIPRPKTKLYQVNVQMFDLDVTARSS